jgi:ankyrin repeat protein
MSCARSSELCAGAPDGEPVMATDTLFAAIEEHDPDRLAELLFQSADPDALQSDPPYWRPLHAAIEELEHGGPMDALVLLLRAGASVDARDGANDATPLLMAVFRGQREAMRLLLGAGADPNVVGSEGDSPLRWCVEHGEYDMAATLLRSSAAATIDGAGGPTGMTALGHAARRLDASMIELLLRHGADPDAFDADRQTAREHMPPRDAETAAAWDRAAGQLGSRI